MPGEGLVNVIELAIVEWVVELEEVVEVMLLVVEVLVV